MPQEQTVLHDGNIHLENKILVERSTRGGTCYGRCIIIVVRIDICQLKLLEQLSSRLENNPKEVKRPLLVGCTIPSRLDLHESLAWAVLVDLCAGHL